MPETPFARRLTSLWAAALVSLPALSGCDRPTVDPLEVQVVVVSPSLETVLTDPTLVLELQALRGTPTTTLRVNGARATYDATRGLYLDTLSLRVGLNAIAVEILDADVPLGSDTLYALRLDLRAAGQAPFPGSAWAGTARLADGRTLVTGGLTSSGNAQSDVVQIGPGGDASTVGMLRSARAGHTATVLPSGEVLLLGGSVNGDPDAQSDLVPTAELVNSTGTSQRVPITGAFQRAGHATRAFEVDGRTVLYAYGGVEPAGAGVVPSATVAILEVIRSPAGPELRVLTPPLGAGNFPPAAEVILADLLPRPGATAAAAALLRDGLAFRFTWQAPGGTYPLDLSASPARVVTAPRRGPAAAPLDENVVLLAGGRTPDGQVLSSMVAFVPSIGRVFAFPASVRLEVPRWRAAATILAARRILISGGLTASGTVTNTSETFTY